MNTFTITVKTEVTYESVSDLLCSALDPAVTNSSGSGYWCEISGQVRPQELLFRAGENEEYPYMEYPLNEGGLIFLKDTESDNGETYTLDLQTVERGLQLMAMEDPEEFAKMGDNRADGATADTFLQYCVFGKVIYG